MSAIRTDFEAFVARSGRNTDDLTRILSALPKAWVAGGAIRRTLIGHALDSDFDFFFRDADDLARWEKELPASFKATKETQHHKQWEGRVDGSDLPVIVQAIRFAYYATAEAVIDSFDYTITQFCLDGTKLVTTPEALWDLGRKRLAIHKVTYPVATMRRMLKYGQQGFTACTGCMATLLNATKDIPLAGMEVAYVD